MNYLPEAQLVNEAIKETHTANRYRSTASMTLHAPVERRLQANPTFARLATFLDHNPFEVEVIFTKMITSPHEIVRSQFENILLVGKMFAGEEIAKMYEYHRQLRDDHEQALLKHEQHIAEREAARLAYEALKKDREENIRIYWHDFIRALQQACDPANNDIAALDEQDRKIIRTMDKDTRHIKLPPTDKEGEFQIDWLMLHNCHSVHICSMLEKVLKLDEA